LVTFFFARQTMLCLAKKSDQPEDGPWKGRNMSLREAMQEHLSNKDINQVVFDYI
jgi:hypothetical protein